jgi:hypothetical protein
VQPLEDADRDVVFAEDDHHNYMARTRTRKLLLCPQAKSQFFALDQDPHELNNLFGDPAFQGEITELKDRLFRWLAFDTLAPTHLDELGPVCDADNVRASNHEDSKREKAWFAEKMKK